MNKQAFLQALRERLSGLPETDIEKIVAYYSESIDDRVEDGLTEAEAVGALGSLEEIVAQLPAEPPVKAKGKTGRRLKAWEIILLVLGSPVWLPLLVAAVWVLLAVYVVLWSVVLVLYAVAASFAAGAAAGVLGCIQYLFAGSFAPGILYFGAGLFCVGAALLLFPAANAAAKGIISLSLRSIKGCFNRKGEAQ